MIAGRLIMVIFTAQYGNRSNSQQGPNRDVRNKRYEGHLAWVSLCSIIVVARSGQLCG